VVKDPARLRTKLVAFNEADKILGEIDTGEGSLFQGINGSPIVLINALGFDPEGNLYVADTAFGGNQFDPPFEGKGGLGMIPQGSLDALADSQSPAEPPVFLAIPGNPDGVEVSRQLLLPLRGQLGQRVATVGRDAEQRGDQRHRLVQLFRAAGQENLQLGESRLRHIVPLEAGGALQLLDQRVQRAGLVIWGALVRQLEMACGREPRAQFPHDPRLADPGLAREQDHLAFAVPGLLPPAQQQRDLLLAPDEGR
jgi:hypothetical protein